MAPCRPGAVRKRCLPCSSDDPHLPPRRVRRGRAGRRQGRAASSRCACRPATRRRRSGRSSSAIRRELMERVPLVDEILVVDDHSTDRTAAVARRGRRHACCRPSDILPRVRRRATARARRCGSRSSPPTATSSSGAMPTSATSTPMFVVGLVGPLLTRPDLVLREGLLRPPVATGPAGGGRVTELVARPDRVAAVPPPGRHRAAAGR